MSERGKNKLPAVQNLHGGRVSASACFIRRHIFVRQSQWIPHRVGIYKIKIVAPVLLIPHFDIIKNIPGHSLAIGKNAEPVRLPGEEYAKAAVVKIPVQLAAAKICTVACVGVVAVRLAEELRLTHYRADLPKPRVDVVFELVCAQARHMPVVAAMRAEGPALSLHRRNDL